MAVVSALSFAAMLLRGERRTRAACVVFRCLLFAAKKTRRAKVGVCVVKSPTCALAAVPTFALAAVLTFALAAVPTCALAAVLTFALAAVLTFALAAVLTFALAAVPTFALAAAHGWHVC